MGGALGHRPHRPGKDFYYVTSCCWRSACWPGCWRPPPPPSREGDGAGWKAALLVALSPGLILAAFVNWDLFAMALAAGGLAAWAARREWLAGVLLGLAVATKFYPLLFFGALLLLCLRAGKLREFGRALGGGAGRLAGGQPAGRADGDGGLGPVLRVQPGPRRRLGIGLVPVRALQRAGARQLSFGALNLISSGGFALACVGIAVLALAAPRRPRLPQLCFLLLAAFLILNKVWSPQYVIWLVPLAVLARPRVWAYVLWQVAEVVYFFGIWGYFVNLYRTPGQGGYAGVTPGWYFVILAARLLTVGLLGVDGGGGHPPARTGPCPGVRTQR